MLSNPSLVTRIAVGKIIGFVCGLIAFIFIPYFLPDVGLLPRWGMLLWYTTFGAIIGVFGVFTYHPILKLPLPWWLRSLVIGAWLNFVLTFFAFDFIQSMMFAVFGEDGILTSPFWFVAEGAFLGIIIGYVATKLGGEGKVTVIE